MEEEIFDPEDNELEDEVDDPLQASNTAQVSVNPADVEGMLAGLLGEPPLPDEQINEVQAALNPGDDTETEKCPECGAPMLAESDPNSLLSFPMKYVWRCQSCDHQEARLDRHVEEHPSADAAMADDKRDEF